MDSEDVFHYSVAFREVLLCQTHHGAKRDGSGGVVVDRDEVDEEGSSAHHGWDHKGPNEHLLNPSSACIQTNQTAFCETFTLALRGYIKPIARIQRKRENVMH